MPTVEKLPLPSQQIEGVLYPSKQDKEIVHLFQATQRSLESGKPWAIGVTSCFSKEGVSSIAGGMAHVASLSGKTTLLCRIEYGRSAHHQSSPDISQRLMQGVSAESLRDGTAWLAEGTLALSSISDQKLLSALASDSERAREIVEALKSAFGQVVFDLPPTQNSSVAASIGRALDGLVMVIEAEKTPAESVRDACKTIQASGGRLLGAVLNKQHSYVPKRLHRRS